MNTVTFKKSAGLSILFILATMFFSGCGVKKADDTAPAFAQLSIASFTPRTAVAGTTVTINGKGFGTEISAIRVRFGISVAAKPISLTDDQITVAVPIDATSGKISVDHTSAGTVLSEVNFEALSDGNDYSVYNKIEYTRTATLAASGKARQLFAGAGNGYLVMFAGGSLNGIFSDDVDIYNLTSGLIAHDNISEARQLLSAAAAGNKIVFAGGQNANGYSDVVDIFDIISNTWTKAKLSKARCRMAAASVGTKIMFAGGESATSTAEKTIDIYNTANNTWSTSTLSVGRNNLAAASCYGKLLFAGGTDANGVASKVVDVFDNDYGKWTTSQMSIARSNFSGAGNGSKLAFAGGASSTFMDVYTVSDGTWTTVNLNDPVNGVSGSIGTKIIFSTNERKSKVYDINTGSVINITNGSTGNNIAAAWAKNVLIFAGNTGIDQTADVYILSK